MKSGCLKNLAIFAVALCILCFLFSGGGRTEGDDTISGAVPQAETQAENTADEAPAATGNEAAGEGTGSAAENRVASTQPSNSTSEPDASKEADKDAEDSSDTANGSFQVTFLDVGQGDSAVVCCDGRYMLIDGGDTSNSQLLYSYFKKQGITTLDYLVATHPDTDHTGGISGALQVATVKHAYCSVTEADQKSFKSMVKYLGKQQTKLEVPSAGDVFSLGSAQVEVVGPLYDADTANDQSIMLRITYGSTAFLFTGDASEDEEADSLRTGQHLSADVLKVGHHGSASSSSAAFLNKVSPKYAVISVGADNSYGHPTQEALTRLTKSGAKVYRTDLQGDIVAKSNGKKVTMSVQKNAKADTLVPGGASAANEASTSSEDGYIGNTRSKKFHRPICKFLPAEHNRVQLSTREEALEKGYSPCGCCNP